MFSVIQYNLSGKNVPRVVQKCLEDEMAKLKNVLGRSSSPKHTTLKDLQDVKDSVEIQLYRYRMCNSERSTDLQLCIKSLEISIESCLWKQKSNLIFCVASGVIGGTGQTRT